MSEDLVDRLRLVNAYSVEQVLVVCRDAADEIERLRQQLEEVRRVQIETTYGYRIHPRDTEQDPHLATIMYTNQPPDGPWHDIATCHPDWVDDILGSLQWREDHLNEQRHQNHIRLQQELDQQ